MANGLLVIPACNEERNIDKVLKDILQLKLDLDIVVINDGSRDRTKEIVKENNVKVISHLYNLGYGGALQTGFKYAKQNGYEYIIQFDGDGQHDPEDIVLMMQELEKGEADILVGSRFLGKGNFRAGILKTIVIRLMRFLIKIATKVKVTDPTSGLKGLSKRTYNYYAVMGNFPSDYPDADVLIQMLRKRYRIQEIPINVRQRVEGKSMHSGIKPIIYLLKVLLSIMVVLLREKLMEEYS